MKLLHVVKMVWFFQFIQTEIWGVYVRMNVKVQDYADRNIKINEANIIDRAQEAEILDV